MRSVKIDDKKYRLIRRGNSRRHNDHIQGNDGIREQLQSHQLPQQQQRQQQQHHQQQHQQQQQQQQQQQE